MTRRRVPFLAACMVLGLAFLYVPIVSMIVFSFNNSRLATIWGGFSTKWYAQLIANRQVLDAARLSLEVAAVSATLATVLGTAAAIALSRFGPFRGRTAFAGMVTSPLVMPEAITGISLLMLFILLGRYLGWPQQRGFATLVIAHATFALAFATTVVQSRLGAMDRSVEEAAADLGARPWQVLLDVTLPGLLPAILSGWLLAFTLSLDNVVISAFTTGPGATTLPLLIWSKMKMGVTPDLNALGTLIVLFMGSAVLLAALAGRARNAKGRRPG